ncbi:hypothetical protein [Streptomyces sp. NRRL S-350]|uniref:hypothetical protein n=1 Tax=Streptomyces sp. NRRL S-350 TaxID=1463902 RepID=UPI0004BEB798|nr:hypothetical protein [Streptomyces sp. NRRL S-350]
MPRTLPDLAAALATHLTGDWAASPDRGTVLLTNADGRVLRLANPVADHVEITGVPPASVPEGFPVGEALAGRSWGEARASLGDRPQSIAADVEGRLLPVYRTTLNTLDRAVREWRSGVAAVDRTAAALASVPGAVRMGNPAVRGSARLRMTAARGGGGNAADVQVGVTASRGSELVDVAAHRLTGTQAQRVLLALADDGGPLAAVERVAREAAREGRAVEPSVLLAALGLSAA